MIKILLLEDNSEDADLLQLQLFQDGMEAEIHRVDELEHFRKGLTQGAFDLVISDFRLRGFTGLEALEVFRQAAISIPFVLLSGTIGEEMAVACLKAGAHDYVMKRNLKRLVPVLQRAIQDCKDRASHRAYQRRYEQIVEQASDGIWVMNLEGKITFANRRLAEILDCPLQLLDDYPIAGMLPESERENFLSKDRSQPRQLRLTCPSLSGSPVPKTVWVTIATSPIHDDFHGTEAILGVMTDISFAKRLESELLQAKKMEAVARLSGGLAHDFNNFLSTIIGFTELAMQEITPPGQAKDCFDEILRAARRGAALTRQLLVVGRRQAPVPELIGLNLAVQDSLEMLGRLIPPEITLEVQTLAEPDTILLDRTALVQVLMNLAINARDAMLTGGMIRIVTNNPEPDLVQLQVVDQGTGITPEIKASMFDPFFTTKEHGKGSGLGLSSVLGIVEQSEGRIEVETTPNLGSTFSIRWPVANSARQQPSLPEFVAAVDGERTILVAEDCDEVRNLYVTLLRRHGYRVLEASNANEALQAEQNLQGPLELLLSDVMMPGLRGPELASLLRDRRPEMRVILISGFGNALSAQDDSPDHFLEKPILPGDLLGSVKELLGV